MKIWTLTTDADEISTTVHTSEREAYDCLRQNFAEDFEGDDGKMVDWLTEEQGLVFYLDEHEVDARETIDEQTRDIIDTVARSNQMRQIATAMEADRDEPPPNTTDYWRGYDAALNHWSKAIRRKVREIDDALNERLSRAQHPEES